jgi:protocatechuate 3,4-dioxygenase beta subunit
MDLSEPEAAPFAISHEMRLGIRAAADQERIDPATRQVFFSIIGQVTQANGEPVRRATVTLVETGAVALTDENGMYHLGAAAAGNYTLRAQSGETAKSVTITIPAQFGKDYNVQL